MSNYAQTTFFTPKDSLPPTNPAKTIFGAAYDIEFGNISTAISSKADAVSVVSSVIAGTGIGVSGATGAVTISNTGVLSIAGTANQIAASASTGAITLSFPSSIIISGGVTTANLSATNLTISGGGQALLSSSVANAFAFQFSETAAAGTNFGMAINAGTNASDIAFRVTNSGGTAEFIKLAGDGSGHLGSSTVLGLSWNTTGQALVNSNASSNYALNVFSAAAGSRGLLIAAGASSSDVCADFNNSANTVAYLRILGEGSVIIGTPTGNGQGLGTLNATGLFVNGGPVYSGIPQNLQSTNYTFVLADANKHVFQNAAGGHTYTIPANASVAFPIGTAITVINGTVAAPMTLSITTDVLTFLPSGSTGSRTIAAGGLGTLLKISATSWVLTGVGIT